MTITGKISIKDSLGGTAIEQNVVRVQFTPCLPPVAALSTAIKIVLRDAGDGWQAADFVDHLGHTCTTVLFNAPFAPVSVKPCEYCGNPHPDRPTAQACEKAAWDDMLQYAYNS